MEPILAKPTSLELKEMIAEILVGSTFSTIRRQIDRDESLLLPFTNTDPSRSQFVEVGHMDYERRYQTARGFQMAAGKPNPTGQPFMFGHWSVS